MEIIDFGRIDGPAVAGNGLPLAIVCRDEAEVALGTGARRC